MKFPYALSNFGTLMRDGYFYQDRTNYIQQLEETGLQLIFIRPRRFGKSLLLSMLEHYYDVNRADQFEALFGKLVIGKNPTPLRNQYFILKWDFSTVYAQGSIQEIKTALYQHINTSIQRCAVYYGLGDIELTPDNAVDSLTNTTILPMKY